MPLFPTAQWLEAYRRALTESEALDDIAEGFAGDICFTIRDVPVAETRVRDLPERVLSGVPADLRERAGHLTLTEAAENFQGESREGLPAAVADLLDQLDAYVHDGTIYAVVTLEGGRCTDAWLRETPGDGGADVTLRASCHTWSQIIDGRPTVAAFLAGDLTAEGARAGLKEPILLQRLGTVGAEVETTYVFGDPETTLSGFVLDEGVRYPSAVQAAAYRKATVAGRLFELF